MLTERDVVQRVQAPDRDAAQGVGRARLDQAGRRGGASFSEADLARAALICNLEDELGFAEEDVPVLLNLIDQIHGLRSELMGLLAALEELPPDIRATVGRCASPEAGKAESGEADRRADPVPARRGGADLPERAITGSAGCPATSSSITAAVVIYAPITTAIIVSLLLSLVLWLFRRR